MNKVLESDNKVKKTAKKDNNKKKESGFRTEIEGLEKILHSIEEKYKDKPSNNISNALVYMGSVIGSLKKESE